jgi:peptide/nickel transport system permease protein
MGYSLPSYVSAILLALVFGYYLQAWTGLNVQGSLFGIDDFGDEKIFWKNLILPALALGIRPIGIITQLTRSSMLDVLSQDYIRTAKAKGLSKTKVIFKHGLRNALNPVVTAVSGWFAALLAGAFFVENVFSYNGLGKITVDALLTRDIPVVLGAILFTAFLFVIINLLVDILYTFLDPRVKLT